jgi:hypothetical protein
MDVDKRRRERHRLLHPAREINGGEVAPADALRLGGAVVGEAGPAHLEAGGVDARGRTATAGVLHE